MRYFFFFMYIMRLAYRIVLVLAHYFDTHCLVLGHNSSYALILYGEHFKGKSEEKEVFENDAYHLKNVFTHRRIHGIP